MNIELLKGAHIQRDNYYPFQLLSKYEEEINYYYKILYSLQLLKDKVDNEYYFYLDFFSEGKGKLSHSSRHRELTETEIVNGIMLLSMYHDRYFEYQKEIRWEDIKKEIIESENSNLYKKLLFKDVRDDYSDHEWDNTKKQFKKALRDFETLGWIRRISIEDGDEVHFMIKESIHRLAKLYDKEINNFSEFVKSYTANKETNQE